MQDLLQVRVQRKVSTNQPTVPDKKHESPCLGILWRQSRKGHGQERLCTILATKILGYMEVPQKKVLVPIPSLLRPRLRFNVQKVRRPAWKTKARCEQWPYHGPSPPHNMLRSHAVLQSHHVVAWRVHMMTSTLCTSI